MCVVFVLRGRIQKYTLLLDTDTLPNVKSITFSALICRIMFIIADNNRLKETREHTPGFSCDSQTSKSRTGITNIE